MNKWTFFFLLALISCDAAPVVFYHVPKTAGSTIMSILDNQFDSKEIYPFFFQKKINESRNLENYNLFHGHFYFSLTQTKIANNAINITFFRNPVDRILSEYRYIIKHFDYLSDEDKSKVFQGHKAQPLFLIHPETNIGVNGFCLCLSSFLEDDPNKSIDEHLASAKKNLEEFFFVGITERMEESIHLLFNLLGWPIPEAQIPRLNTTDGYIEKYPDELIEEIKRLNWADIELYEFAKTLFERKLEQSEQKILLDKPPVFVKNYSYTFDMPFDGDGWYFREGTTTNSPLWRWSGPDPQANIYVPIETNSSYTMQFTAYAPLDILDKLQVMINGRLIELERLTYEGWCKFSAFIPESYLIPGKKTQITFKSHRVFQPSQLSPGLTADDRWLGVSLNQITLSADEKTFECP